MPATLIMPVADPASGQGCDLETVIIGWQPTVIGESDSDTMTIYLPLKSQGAFLQPITIERSGG